MKVYVFTAHQAVDSEVLESHIEVFYSREQAIKTLKEWRDDEMCYVKKRGWYVHDDKEDYFEAYEVGYYATDHCEFSVDECEVKGAPQANTPVTDGKRGASLDDVVTIICYNKKERKTRRDAIEEFSEAMAYCEGSERDRYTNIFMQLMAGRMECDDRRCL